MADHSQTVRECLLAIIRCYDQPKKVRRCITTSLRRLFHPAPQRQHPIVKLSHFILKKRITVAQTDISH